MFLATPGQGAGAGAGATVCRVGWAVNVHRVQITRARARSRSNLVPPSASALPVSTSSAVQRLPLNGCSVTSPMVMVRGRASSSALSRLHLKADSDGVCIKRQQAEELLPALIPIEDGGRVLRVHGFSERANWLVPGKILLGKYPGQIPSDLPTDRQTARDRIREVVLRGGATDFLSLQAELPPQADENQWDAPVDPTDDGFFFSGFRAYRGDAVAAVKEGRENRNASPPSGGVNGESRDGGGGEGAGTGAVAVAAATGLTFHHFPIPDLSPAENIAVLSGLVDDLDLLVKAGKVLFIHCWAGRGRTGLIAACLLGKLYPDVDAEQALNRVDTYYRCRGTVAVGKTRRVSPETEEQEDQVRLFFEKVLKR